MAGELNISQEYQRLRQEIDQTRAANDKLVQSMKEVNTSLNKNTASQKNLSAATKKVATNEQQLTAEQKKLANVQNQLNQLTTKQGRELEKAKLQLSEKRKATKQAAKEELGLSGAYEKQSKRLATLRKRYKDIAVSQGTASKSAQKLQRRIQVLDTRLKKADASAGQFQRNVGNYPSALNKAGQAMKGFIASAVGITVILGGIVRGIRDAIRTTIDFESANSELAGVLGTTRSGVAALTGEAERLGGVTAKSASEVTSLQTAYARLGFSQQEIINLTEGTIAGSVAMRAELASTAELTGSLVNSFENLSTTDAPRILDTLTLSTQKTALNFERLSTAIPIAGGAAAGANVPFETMIDHLGQAADRGIDASTSATSLRNIYLELSKKGLTLDQALQQINSSQDKLSAANDLFGKRAAVTALALASNAGEATEFNKALEDVEGTAQRVADEQLDNLQGDLTLLNSAWESFNITVTKTGGMRKAVQGLTSVITFLTESVRTLRRDGGLLAATFTTLGQAMKVNFQTLGAIITAVIIEPIRFITGVIDTFIKKGVKQAITEVDDLWRDSVNRQKDNAKGLVGAYADAGKNIVASYKGTGEEIENVQDGTAENANKNADKIIAANQKVNDEWQKTFDKQQSALDKLFDSWNAEYDRIFNKAKSLSDLFKEIDQEGQDVFDQVEANQSESIQGINEQIDANIEKETEATERKLELIEREKQAKQDFKNLSVDLSNQLFELGAAQREAEIADIQAKVDAGVITEEQGARKEKQIMREQARAEKRQAIFNAVINVAEAVTKFGVISPQAILAGIVGGVQIATIANRPIPQFWKGVENFEGGPAMVGEKGFELLDIPGKGTFMSPDKPTMVHLPRGSDVIPHYESEQIIQGGIQPEYFDKIITSNKEIKKSIDRMEIHNTNITGDGWMYSTKRANNRIKRIDKYFR